jgi:glycerol-3-phosphate dehydrogenase (NAD(P)+)
LIYRSFSLNILGSSEGGFFVTTKLNHISIIGAGAWGTALAEVLADAGRVVTLYARSADLADAICSQRENALYLPGVRLNPAICATHDAAVAVQGADLVLLTTPAQFLRGTLKFLKPLLPAGVPLVNCAKGIEIETGKLLSEVARDVVPLHPYAVFSGPTFAGEVARGMPAAVTLATAADAALGRLWAESLHGKSLRPYLSSDPVGAEASGALKNVIAIACGIVEGKKLGQNARAAIMTRGMAEIKRFGLLKGAAVDTFLGLSGLGDLTLTCNSMASRNFSLGYEIGSGGRLQDIMASRRTVAEGVATARAITILAETGSIDMPICRGVDRILHGGAQVDEVIAGLLTRSLRSEAA